MSADTQRGVERLVGFSDGVVAIAITLLILPLTDIETGGQSAWTVLVDNRAALLGFGLSFAVIANYWMAHHRLLRSLHSCTTTLIRINTVWLALIAFLPFPTSLIEDDIGHGFATVYIATLLAVSVLTLVLARYLVLHPELRHRASTTGLRAEVLAGWAAAVALAAAGTVSVASAPLGLVALLLTLPAQQFATAAARRQDRRLLPAGSARVDQPPALDEPLSPP